MMVLRGWRRRKTRRRLSLVVTNTINSLLLPTFNVVLSLLVVRLASAELWGAFVGILIVVQIAVQVIAWGNKEYLLRQFSLEPGRMAEHWQSSLFTRALLFFCIGGLVLLLPWPPVWKALALLWVFGFALYQSYEVVMLYRRAFRFSIWVEAATSLLLIGVVLWQRSQLTVTMLLAAFAVVFLLKAALFTARFRGDVWAWHDGAARHGRVEPIFLRLTLPFFLLGFAGLLQSRVDLYSVAYFLPDQQVAQYQVLINLLIYLQALASLAVQPFVRSLYRMEYGVFVGLAWRMMAVAVVFVVPAMLVIRFILTRVYQFTLSPGMLVIGGLYVLPVYFYSTIVYALFKANQQRLVTIVSFVAALLNLLLNFILIPRGGMTGALVAATLIHWLAFAFYLRQSRLLELNPTH